MGWEKINQNFLNIDNLKKTRKYSDGYYIKVEYHKLNNYAIKVWYSESFEMPVQRYFSVKLTCFYMYSVQQIEKFKTSAKVIYNRFLNNPCLFISSI
jgi:hypothetical protein